MEYILYSFGAIAALLTFLLQHKMKMNVVVASALPSFVLALLFHFIHFEWSDSVLTVVFTASFVGMSATNFNSLEIALAGVISSFLVLNFPLMYTGFGGGMGTSAFLSIIFCFGLVTLYTRVKAKRKAK